MTHERRRPWGQIIQPKLNSNRFSNLRVLGFSVRDDLHIDRRSGMRTVFPIIASVQTLAFRLHLNSDLRGDSMSAEFFDPTGFLFGFLTHCGIPKRVVTRFAPRCQASAGNRK